MIQSLPNCQELVARVVGGSIASGRRAIELGGEIHFLIPQFLSHQVMWAAYELLGAHRQAESELALLDAAIATGPAWQSTIIAAFVARDQIHAVAAAAQGRVPRSLHVEDALGHAEEASGARAEGRRIVERIASTLADRALEDGFRNTPTVRSLFAGRAAEGRTAK